MNKEEYIKKLAKKSKSDKHELIVECLAYYNAYGTKDLTVEQLEEYCQKKGII